MTEYDPKIVPGYVLEYGKKMLLEYPRVYIYPTEKWCPRTSKCTLFVPD